MSLCASCGAPLTGPYCAACGEKALEADDLDWRKYVFKELPQTLFEIDGAVVRTLVDLFTRPGQLAQAFVTGRRRGTMTPFRLYVVAFLAYELTAALMGHGHAPVSAPERARLLDPTGGLQKLMDLRGPRFWTEPATNARLDARSRWASEVGTFLIAAVLAGIQSLVFIRLKRRYLEHLALALNVTGFFLICAAVGQIVLAVAHPVNASDAAAQLQTALALVALPVYWFFSVIRFYRISRLAAAGATLVMTAGMAAVAWALNIVVLAALIVTA